MKRVLAVTLALVLITALASCGKERADDVPNLETIPTREEIADFCDGKSWEQAADYMSQVVLLVSRPEAQQEISDAFAKWLAGCTDIAIQGYELGYSETMGVNMMENQKFLRQYVLTAKIYLEADRLKELTAEEADALMASCDEALRADTVAFYRLAAIELDFCAIGSDSTYNSREKVYVPKNYGTNYNEMSGSVDWQLPGEFAAQTIAYDFAKKLDEEYYGPDYPGRMPGYPAAFLQQIGAKDGEVYIVIYLDAPVDKDDLRASTEKWAKELYDDIMADENAAGYLKTYGTKKTVIFFGEYGEFEF